MHPPALFISKESIASSSSKKILKLSLAPIFQNPPAKAENREHFEAPKPELFPASLEFFKYDVLRKQQKGAILPSTKLEIKVKTWAVEWLLNRKLNACRHKVA
jgi:hypothetical protein